VGWCRDCYPGLSTRPRLESDIDRAWEMVAISLSPDKRLNGAANMAGVSTPCARQGGSRAGPKSGREPLDQSCCSVIGPRAARQHVGALAGPCP